jgi:hypothetical protein
MQMANGTLASNTYDNANQLLLVANLTTSGTTLSSFNYKYDPAGNRTQIVEPKVGRDNQGPLGYTLQFRHQPRSPLGI